MTIDPYLFHNTNIYRSIWTTDMFELFPLYIMVLYRYTNKSIMILNLSEHISHSFLKKKNSKS